MTLMLVGLALQATDIKDRIQWPDGSYPSGQMTISWPSFAYGGITVPTGVLTVPIKNGIVRVTLKPFNSYVVRYALQGGMLQQQYGETWNVNNTSSPLTINTVKQLSSAYLNLSGWQGTYCFETARCRGVQVESCALRGGDGSRMDLLGGVCARRLGG